MTLQEFKQELLCHDWYYNFTDDYSVWKKGETKDGKLRAIAIKGGPEFVKAYNKECSKVRNTAEILRANRNPSYIRHIV